MSKDQPSLAIEGNVVDSSRAAIAIGSLRVDASHNACPSQTQSIYHAGNGNMVGTWDTCLPDVNAEGLESSSYGVYTDSSSLPFHGYGGYTPQMPQRPYPSFATPPQPVNCHGQLLNVRELPNSEPPYYQQLISPNIPNISSQTSVSLAKLPVNINPQGDGNRFEPQPGYLPSLGSFGRGSNFSGESGGFKFLQQGYDGFENSGLWSDWSKPGIGKGSFAHLSSSTAGPKPIGSLGLSVNHFGMDSPKKESFYGFGSRLGSTYKSYPQGQNNRNSGYDVVSSSMFGMSGQSWPTLHEAKQGGRCNDFSCNCNIALDTLSERNRGPRAFKPRGPAAANGSVTDNHRNAVSDICNESYNRLDFVTDYKDAKFFVIKSYSEDNVHKSIKYSVWASTPNGNKKLDAAYHEAIEKHGACPVFLLFSVNASAQFCGVAEMVGPVDFDKSVDYWQQDKWSGQFPVKWHIIKDVPNNQFRHIVLENNDNKPVTNSRDTQEVELEHGVEMLKIFKNYESHSSILDDFHFYEERQKAMQARKSRQHQQATLVSSPVIGDNEQTPVSISNAFIQNMSKSFAEAVSLKETETKLSMSHLPHGAMGVQHENRS
ncbi:YTH domain-containing protein ECT1 isoform X2 [Jatropha curcas]|uniref:YTH domain-containing protein ECT1 isoform X2 n=1 Tax=Jatropha curcas TaxID=180498 RepID=UPI0005FAEAE4|nr:YTH domain-containing protein ECT1 isoform X2 [Jatropha curcas]XP_020539091.1 YTH domain-containing protein ECT1 isoform X2 [Jatropha curcas]